MHEFLPVLILGAIIGLLTLVFGSAYLVMRHKSSGKEFDRNMTDKVIIRRLLGEESRPLILGCALGGAALLTGCDILARTLFAPYVLPVGIILSLLGGPFFIWLLLRQRGG